MMMALDQFVFSLDTLAYQELQRDTSWNHASNSRVGARPARQYTGQGDDSITLNGVLLPDFQGSVESLDTLRSMGDRGDAYAMVDGGGKVYGAFVIEGVTEGQTIHTKEGKPRRIDFTVKLSRVDDDQASFFKGGESMDGALGYIGAARGYLNTAQGYMSTAKGYLSTVKGLASADAASYVKGAVGQVKGAIGGAIGGGIKDTIGKL